MANWLIYLRERIPLFTFCFLAAGISLSGHFLAPSTLLAPSVISFLGLFLLLIALRLVGDFNNIEKERVENPEYPLVDGVLTPQKMIPGIHLSLALMLLLSAGLTLYISKYSGIVYGIVTLYVWLMYHEFFVGKWLNQRPFLNAISRLTILFPVSFFTIAITNPSLFSTRKPIWFALLLFGAFLTYEICRKYDPKPNPPLKTYRDIYGTPKTAAIVYCALLIAAIGANPLGLTELLWGVEAYMALSTLIVPRVYPLSGRPIEILAALCLALHVWAIPLNHWIKTTSN